MQFWTMTHVKTLLPSLAVMLALAVLLRSLLKGKSERVRMIPFQVVASLIAVLEIIKQIRSLALGYDLWHLPFHACSVITVCLPLMAFYRGRYQQALRGVTVAFSAGLFVLMLIIPNGIYSDGAIQCAFQDFGDFHITVFHTLAMAAFVLIFALELHVPHLRCDMRATLVVMTCYCTVASVMAHILKTNYHNFYRCILEPVEQLRLAFCEALGAFAGQVLYVVLFSIVNILGVLAAYFLYDALWHLMQRVHAPAHTSAQDSGNGLVQQ